MRKIFIRNYGFYLGVWLKGGVKLTEYNWGPGREKENIYQICRFLVRERESA